ncbi:MAG: hypothetical protein EA342_00530 [Leptolyngbya sp. LCM1.Bin17]|nr:MAG: hypothetical protein EA342_00530 [Leptolyngbya sp. LCM1.Bin17]
MNLNGTGKRTIQSEFGEAEIGIPRDRNGAFEPQFIQPDQTRFTGFDGKILSLYARGMTTRSHALVPAGTKAWEGRTGGSMRCTPSCISMREPNGDRTRMLRIR